MHTDYCKSYSYEVLCLTRVMSAYTLVHDICICSRRFMSWTTNRVPPVQCITGNLNGFTVRGNRPPVEWEKSRRVD